MQIYDYYRSGSDSESTVKFNRDAFNNLRLLPRMLVDVSKRDISTELLGKHRLMHQLAASHSVELMNCHPHN